MEIVKHQPTEEDERTHSLIQVAQATSEQAMAFPLARITTCGTLTIQVLQSIHSSVGGQQEAIYGPPDPALLAKKGASTAFILLALLTSQPGSFVKKDWLSEKLGHFSKEEDADGEGLKRVDNVVSRLRSLLYPPRAHESQEEQLLRRRIVEYRRASGESGPGYQLAGMPLVWLDVAEIEAHVKRARRLEQFGEDGLTEWQAAYELAIQGIFLPGEVYSDWTEWRRQAIETHLWDCVQVLWKRWVEQGTAGETEALRILRDYWQRHVTSEDALRPLLELLGKRECFGEARDYYDQFCAALDLEGKQPDQRTRDIMDFQQAVQIQRKQAKVFPPTQQDAQLTNLPWIVTHSRVATRGELESQSLSFGSVTQSAQEMSFSSPGREIAQNAVLLVPPTVVQRENTVEAMHPDCATLFGIQLAQAVMLVHQWHGMSVFCNELQNQLDQEIKHFDILKMRYSLEEYTLSRRNFLSALAFLPTAFLTTVQQKHKLLLILEDLLPTCAASITACWHLSSGSNLDVIQPIIDSYLPTLITVCKHAPAYREVAADLVAQAYFLKAILAWHLEGLDIAEAYCAQAMTYSSLTKNVNLRLTALNQHALISYYNKNFQKALEKSETAATILLQEPHEPIFPIVRGRVYMYLAAIQARQKHKNAKQTLEYAQTAFASQAAVVEPVPIYADCGDAPLTLWEGITLYYRGPQDFGDAKQALTSLSTFGQLETSTTIPERFRLECLNSRILAAIQLNNLEEALACFEVGRRGARALESKQRSREISYAYQRMQRQWPTEQKIKQLGSLIREE